MDGMSDLIHLRWLILCLYNMYETWVCSCAFVCPRRNDWKCIAVKILENLERANYKGSLIGNLCIFLFSIRELVRSRRIFLSGTVRDHMALTPWRRTAFGSRFCPPILGRTVTVRGAICKVARRTLASGLLRKPRATSGKRSRARKRVSPL